MTGDHELTWSDDTTPFSRRFGDHFYSEEDGRAETDHVFLRGNGLPRRWRGTDRFEIAELGFGTGLNFLETWRQWTRTRDPSGVLNFTSFEGYPLGARQIGKAIGRWTDLQEYADRLLNRWSDSRVGRTSWRMDEQTRLTVVRADAAEGLTGWDGLADAWYLDGFAPSRNPEMWSLELMRMVFERTAPGGSLASFTSAGWVRRNLRAAGFEVKKAPGFGAKREMIVGRRPARTIPS